MLVRPSLLYPSGYARKMLSLQHFQNNVLRKVIKSLQSSMMVNVGATFICDAFWVTLTTILKKLVPCNNLKVDSNYFRSTNMNSFDRTANSCKVVKMVIFNSRSCASIMSSPSPSLASSRNCPVDSSPSPYFSSSSRYCQHL